MINRVNHRGVGGGVRDSRCQLRHINRRPIRSVAGGLEGIAQGEGDLTYSLVMRGNDETAHLVPCFNQLLAAIRVLIQRISRATTRILDNSASRTRVTNKMAEATWRQCEAPEMVSTANEVACSCSQAAQSADSGKRQAREG